MAQKSDVIVKGTSSQIVYTFVFADEFAELGLNNFTDIVFLLGDEEYTLISGKVVITSNTELTITISDDTQLPNGEYSPTVLGVSAAYPDGYPLVHRAFMPYMKVCVYDKV